MRSFCCENENLNRITDDGVRVFCLREKVNEDHMRSLIERARGVEGNMRMESEQ